MSTDPDATRPARRRLLYTGTVQALAAAGARYAIRTFPSAVVHGVDIDPHALELGARHFGLAPHPRLQLHVADGRQWLAASDDASTRSCSAPTTTARFQRR